MHQIRDQEPGATGDDRPSTPADRRKRYEAVLQMIETWRSDPGDYEERIWPDLVRQIDRVHHSLPS